MAERINLDTDTVTLKYLFEEAGEWEKLPASELTSDQLAIINLKRLIETKGTTGGLGGGSECFICGTGA